MKRITRYNISYPASAAAVVFAVMRSVPIFIHFEINRSDHFEA